MLRPTCRRPYIDPFKGSTLFRILRCLGLLAIIITSVVAGSPATAATAPCLLPTTRSNTVTDIIDARTLKLDDGTQLRLASILGPTPYDSPSAPKKWPDEATAIDALTRRVLGKNIAISLERTSRDRYGRRVGQGLLINATDSPAANIENNWLQALAVRAGEVRVALTPAIDEACATLLLAIEAEATTARRGLWRLALYNAKRADAPDQLLRYRSTFQIVEGTVIRVAPGRSAVYLNFGTNWKRDFTAKFSRPALRRANIRLNILKRITKRTVRIRGWIEKRNGPLITLWRPEQIELLSQAAGGVRRLSPPKLLTDLRPGNRGQRK